MPSHDSDLIRDSEGDDTVPFDASDLQSSPSPTAKSSDISDNKFLLKHIIRKSASDPGAKNQDVVGCDLGIAMMKRSQSDVQPRKRITLRRLSCTSDDPDAEVTFRPSLRLRRKFKITPLSRDEFDAAIMK